MKSLIALLVVLLLVPSSGAMAQNYNFPDSPTLNQIVTGPGGQQFQWDGTKWVSLSGAGGGPYLPLAGGTMSGPVNNVTALGIGAAAPTGAAGVLWPLLQATHNANFLTALQVTNSTSGTDAGTILYLGNDVSPTESWVLTTSSTYTGSGPALPGDAMQIASVGANGIVFATNIAITPGPPIVFWSGPDKLVQIGGPPPFPALSVTQTRITNAPVNTAAGLLGMQAHGNWNAVMSITNNDPGINAGATIYLNNGVPHYAALQMNGTNGTSNGLPADSVAFQSDTAGGIYMSDAADVPIGFLTGGGTGTSGMVAWMDGQGIHVAGTGNYWLGGRSISQSSSGAWVPQALFGGSSAGVSCNVCDGAWSVSGQNITVSFVMNLITTGSSGGAATVAGLPANLGANTASNWYGTCVVLGGMSIAPGYVVVPQMAGGAIPQIMLEANDASTNGWVGLNNANILNGTNLQCTISYMLNI